MPILNRSRLSQQQRARADALSRYMIALDAEDRDTAMALKRQAAQDPILTAMLMEVNDVYAAECHAIAMATHTWNHPQKE